MSPENRVNRFIRRNRGQFLTVPEIIRSAEVGQLVKTSDRMGFAYLCQYQGGQFTVSLGERRTIPKNRLLEVIYKGEIHNFLWKYGKTQKIETIESDIEAIILTFPRAPETDLPSRLQDKYWAFLGPIHPSGILKEKA